MFDPSKLDNVLVRHFLSNVLLTTLVVKCADNSKLEVLTMQSAESLVQCAVCSVQWAVGTGPRGSYMKSIALAVCNRD